MNTTTQDMTQNTESNIDIVNTPIDTSINTYMDVNGYHISQFAKGFQKNGMLEYVKEVQRRERDSGNDLLTHQKWSGAGIIDYVNYLISRNGVTNINSDNSTEKQF